MVARIDYELEDECLKEVNGGTGSIDDLTNTIVSCLENAKLALLGENENTTVNELKNLVYNLQVEISFEESFNKAIAILAEKYPNKIMFSASRVPVY